MFMLVISVTILSVMLFAVSLARVFKFLSTVLRLQNIYVKTAMA